MSNVKPPAKKRAAAKSSPVTKATCTTCSGSGATNVMPSSKENTEKLYNKGASIRMGMRDSAGKPSMGETCTNCGGKGMQ